MQGWKRIIPTLDKIRYINALLKVGFNTIDFGSFVSPKLIPQMADTKEVLRGLNLESTKSKLLAIVANLRGAEDAIKFEEISYLGFPFSISETFQQRNTNSTINESLGRVEEIQNLCIANNKKLVIYISMAFGNPYNDLFSPDILLYWVTQIGNLGIQIISLADTVGVATPEQVFTITDSIVSQFQEHEIGVHLHSSPLIWREKIDGAFNAGSRRFDGALKGIGGCPMANDELVGNMDTESMIKYFSEKNVLPPLNTSALNESLKIAAEIFS